MMAHLVQLWSRVEAISAQRMALINISPYTPLWTLRCQRHSVAVSEVKGNTALVGAFCIAPMTHDRRFRYLFPKYRIAGSRRTFPVQKRFTSRGRVSSQSYTTNARCHNVSLTGSYHPSRSTLADHRNLGAAEPKTR